MKKEGDQAEGLRGRQANKEVPVPIILGYKVAFHISSGGRYPLDAQRVKMEHSVMANRIDTRSIFFQVDYGHRLVADRNSAH
jgi:hypothetical protein